MSFYRFPSFAEANNHITCRYFTEESDDPSMRVHLLLAVPSVATMGEVMAMLYWAKGVEFGTELTEEVPSTFTHYTIKVSVKLEYVRNLLVMLYASGVGGFLYTE
jgi:hypothetical protein